LEQKSLNQSKKRNPGNHKKVIKKYQHPVLRFSITPPFPTGPAPPSLVAPKDNSLIENKSKPMKGF